MSIYWGLYRVTKGPYWSTIHEEKVRHRRMSNLVSKLIGKR